MKNNILIDKFNTPLGFVQERYLQALCNFASIRWSEYHKDYVVIPQMKSMQTLPRWKAQGVKRHATPKGDSFSVLATYQKAVFIRDRVHNHLNVILNLPDGENVPIEMVWDVLFTNLRTVSYRGGTANVNKDRLLEIMADGKAFEHKLLTSVDTSSYNNSKDSFDQLFQ